jgi:glycosyltransferase involved in cell wall biosynthesis
MPLYNCEIFVEDSIRSVLHQTYQGWELIIVDDKSSDRSVAVVEKYMKNEPRIKLYQLEKNSGAAAARNHAIDFAKGKYIAFLDSDDLWTSDKLETQVSFMMEKKSVLSFSTYWLMNEKGEVGSSVVSVPSCVKYEDLLKKNTIGCLTAMYDSTIFGKRYFDVTLDMHEDYQYWLEILKEIDHADGMNIPLAYHRIRSNSLSRNKIAAARSVWKILREYQNIPFFNALYYFTYYIMVSLQKYSKPIT